MVFGRTIQTLIILSDFTVDITVTLCYYAVISDTSITSQTYQVNGTAITNTIPAFSNNDTTCPIAYTLTINCAAYTAPVGAISYNTATRVLTMYSTSVGDKGLFNMRLTGTNDIWTYYGDFTVDITVTPCYHAVVTANPISSYSYEINQTSATYTLLPFSNNDTTCPITYTL